MYYENLIDLSLDEIENIIFHDSIFPNDEALEYLDVYLKTNFTENVITINKENLLKLSKIIVNALSFLLITKLTNIEIYKIRWILLSDLCAEYLSSKSAFSAYQDIIKLFEKTNNNNELPKIINFLFNKKVATISEIQEQVGKPIEYIQDLLIHFEDSGIITRSSLGKNKLIRLSSIGLDIYNKFTKHTNLSYK